jgi:hypothetical protein
MSEYQYHEWQTVDRLLTSSEQAAVENLSSHIEVSSSRALVTYNWSGFRHDPKQVLLDYFDAYFYFANWGSLDLMFRFPKGVLDSADVEPYCIEDSITYQTNGNYQVLDLTFGSEDGGGWMETEADLSQFIRLRADLLEGDYRLLYLAWLKGKTQSDVSDDYDEGDSDGTSEEDYYNEDDMDDASGEEDPDDPSNDREPPVPPGLNKLSPPLQNFVQIFGIDPFLVQSAAEASPELHKSPTIDYRELLGRLPRSECDDFLTRLAEGDPGVGVALRKRLSVFLPRERVQRVEPRTIQELLWRAEYLRKVDKQRQAEAARQNHIARMQDLAARESQTWQQVDILLTNGRKIASTYDQVTGILENLNQLSQYQNTREAFHARLRQLAQKYSARTALIDRWKRHGWI